MKRLLLGVSFAIACAVLPLTVFADVSEATFTANGSDTYGPENEGSVEVFVVKPDFAFKVIGIIEARGMAETRRGILDALDITTYFKVPPGEREDMALAIKALKSEAANAGATGVVITQSAQVQVGPRSTERRIKAFAIRRTQ